MVEHLLMEGMGEPGGQAPPVPHRHQEPRRLQARQAGAVAEVLEQPDRELVAHGQEHEHLALGVVEAVEAGLDEVDQARGDHFRTPQLPDAAPIVEEPGIERALDQLAVRLSRAALDEGGGLGARVVNGAGLARLGRVEEAEEVLAAADLGPATDAERVALTVARTDNLFWALGDLDTTLGVIDGVRAGLTDPEADAELGVNAAVYQFMSGRPGDAITLLEPVMDAAPDRVVVTAAMALAPSLAVTGRGEDGAAFVERAIAIRRSLEEPVRLTELSMLHMSHGFVLAAAGRIEEAVAAARRGYDLAVERRDRHGEAWCAMVLTLASHQAGRVRACARWAAEGAATFTEVGMDALARVCRAGRMHALSLLGDAEAARGLRVEVEAGEDRFATLEPEVLRALAWERATSGDEPAAVEMLLDAADRSGEVGACFYEAVVLHDVVRLGRADDVADRLADAARGQQSAVMATMADHGRAAAAGDGTGLGAVSDRFVDHGAALLAAEAAAQSAGAHASGGDERTGRRWARRSAEVMATIDPVRTPALALAGGAGRLTPREREVATASAEGRSNREVAEKLGVSVRTVETHLHRVYDKLGTDRAGLPAALDPTAD
ncbi:MAG: helix-turn-helix transcriptional regulator [Actinomycetota bacterium]